MIAGIEEKENEFCALTSKIFQGENVLQIRLNLALIDLSSSSIYESTSTFFSILWYQHLENYMLGTILNAYSMAPPGSRRLFLLILCLSAL